jgi:glycosyltransferase involved in cell wall biosynthesis
MRILYWVRVGEKFGSFEKYLILLAKICKSHGYDFQIINDVENKIPIYLEQLSLYGVHPISFGDTSKEPLLLLPKVVSYIRNWKPDIVHLHFINSGIFPFLRFLGFHLVYKTYHSGINYSISLRTKTLRMVDNLFVKRVFAVSNRVLDDEIRAGVWKSKIQIQFLGLPIEEIRRDSKIIHSPIPYGWNDQATTKIITVGRFFPEKGMPRVVEAAIHVVQKRKDVIWWIIGGEGPDLPLCNRLIAENGANEQIIILGNRNDVPALFSQSFIHVVGSHYEGLPLASLEGALLNVPTVGPKIRGLDEAVIDGVTGILLSDFSSKNVANSIFFLLDNKNKVLEMGRKSKEYIENKFDATHQIEGLLTIYENDISINLKNDFMIFSKS